VYPLGHIGITLLLSKIVSKRFNVRIDFRLMFLASMLPDILDKPLGFLGIGGGRFFFHSLIFVASLYLIRKELFFGSVVHLILDRIWENPEALFFPFLGFEMKTVYPWNYIEYFLRSRYTQIGELLGAISLVLFRVIDRKPKT
jgi:hypothetical protein